MRDALVACMGWMIDAKDHSAHEILTSAKSFELEYTAGPDSYLQIRPEDDVFLDKLKQAQAARGFKMPDEYLSSKHAHALAEEIFAEKMTVDVEQQRHDKENIMSNAEVSLTAIEKQKRYKATLTVLREKGVKETIPRAAHTEVIPATKP